MLILPLAHESQRVQRLPWVTFIIITLNVVLLLYTDFFAGVDESALNDRFDKFYEYLSSHPYLDVPPEMQQYFTEKDEEQLQEMRESTPRSDLDQETIDSQQEELNGIAGEITGMMSADPLKKWGYVPKAPHAITLFTYMFLHAGFLHLIGNMLFLYLAGCSIEDLWGRPVYISFYLISGIVSAWMHAFRFPDGAEPLVGASGAIAGLMGAFALRLYKTKITFFYLIWIRWGTFQAPAYVMLPLWFLQQLIYAGIADQSEVAFHAHIGGFIFGVLVAVLIRSTGFEDKYLAPAIEKKVSLVQNPLYLQAMEKSEQGDYTGALLLLEKVVRQEPDHLDAFMEMRRISEINRDETGFAKYTAGLLDALMRIKESNLLETTYRQYLDHPNRIPLPSKTIFALAGFFDEEQDPNTSLHLYQILTAAHPDDPITMKGWSRMARIYFDKLSDPEKGKAALLQAYEHPRASYQWRSALQSDFRRYGIEAPVAGVASPVRPAHPEPAVKPAPVPAPLAPEPAVAEINTGMLPNSAFDGDISENITVVSCQVNKMVPTGLTLSKNGHAVGILPYRKICYMSSGRVRNTGSTEVSSEGEMFILDLVTAFVERSKKFVVYRLQGRRIQFNKIFPLVEQTSQEAFQNFAGILANNSGAECLPDRDRCLGPVFAVYQNWNEYETQLRERLMRDA
jgi:membrane associated rhomboid family serine protease